MKHHECAFGDKSARHAFSDAGAGTGHEDDLVLQARAGGRGAQIHGFNTPFTISPACMASNASRHSVRGATRLSSGVRSILPAASRASTCSQTGQLWEKLP